MGGMRLILPDSLLQNWRRSVRLKLLTLVLVPLLLGTPILLIIVWIWGTQGYNQLLVNKVSSDLVTARQYFDRVQVGVETSLSSFAASERLASARRHGLPLQTLLHTLSQEQGLDYLLLLDLRGRPLASSLGQADTATPLSRHHWPVVREALDGTAGHGLEIFTPEQLATLAPALLDQAHIPLLPTRDSPVNGKREERRGLVIQAAVPLRDEDGRIQGVLEGGVLLNGNLGIVDSINAIVYQDASLPHGSQGTATLFLEDVRIATNVGLFAGSRALGTRVSPAVRHKVLERGEIWLGSAFVVNNTYISGYEPLLNRQNQRIGMLYVGFLEAPLQNDLHQALALLFLLFLLVSGLGTLATLRGARAIFRPLEQMSGVMEKIEAGDEQARMGTTAREDELGRLSRAFDHLLDSLAHRRAELQNWAEELDHKVAARTAELEAANATLTRAQQQLVMNEKLTAIGELTAGVAHEINNPVAVIQGNLELLRDILGPDASAVHDEIRLIDEQISRIRLIVTKLLQFARPGDFAGYVEATDLNEVVADSLMLTRHNLNLARVQVETRLAASRPAEINRIELQQVLINLIVNALQAMPEGGRLLLQTEDTSLGGEPGALIRVVDSGHGIAEGDLARIFDPFFTTKKQEGTGLGLSISYAIIKRYGGRISVASQLGQGTTFTIELYGRARYSEEPAATGFTSRLFAPSGNDA